MKLIDLLKEKFRLWRKERVKNNRPPLWFSVGLGVVIFIILWTGIAMGGLRVFIPEFFTLVGSPFSSKSYLIVFQNDTELRPTGGFISAYGVLDFKYGFWPRLRVSDVYGSIDDHPYVAPPYPMADLLANQWYQGYTFRDANYNPDFPSSANDLITFYKKTNPDAVFDGVVAVDFSLIQKITAVLGSVDVDNKEFTGDNLFEMMEENVSNVDRHNEDALANRKNVLRDFAKTLIKDVILSPLHWRKISDAVVSGLNQKDILLAFSEPSLRHFADSHDWEGTMMPTQSKDVTDFLSVVEANLGGMKSDRYITRDITYAVDLTNALKPVAHVTVTLAHHGNYNEPLSGDYTGYLRTYSAPGSTDLPENLHQETSVTLSGWGEVVHLKPGESATLSYTYTLPHNVLQNDLYSLFLRKQPGTHDDHIRVVVTLPQGEGVESTTFTPQESMAYYEGFLNQDTVLSFTALPDRFGPRVSFQEITALNRIEIHFNEKVEGDVATDPLNYVITDLDKTNASLHDSVSITDIEHFDKTVIVHTKGMTAQNEEFYSIELRNITDTNGNVIDPNPREITVVQRL